MVNLLNIQNYWAYWYGIRKSCATDKEAWEAVEEDMAGMYGFGQYDNYEAFRVGKQRYTLTLKDKLVGDINVSDVITVPGYMENYYVFRTHHPVDVSDKELWSQYSLSIETAFGVRMYDNYEAFRKARQRYVQGLRNRNHKIWKTKLKH